MKVLTVNGKQMTLKNMNVHINYNGPMSYFDGHSTLYAGVYEFRVNVPDAVVVRCRNLPVVDGTDTVLPIVNGVATLVLTSDVYITNSSIWPVWLQPEEYKDDPHYTLPVDLNSSNFELVRVNSGKIFVYGVPSPVLEEVTIGNQTWLAKNLSIDDGGEGIYTQVLNYGQGNVTEYYYNWDAAMRIAESLEGWHVPTLTEAQTLISNVGGSSVAGLHTKSTYGWYNNGNGDDSYGLSIFPAGYWYNNTFYDATKRSIFWTSTKRTETRPYAFNVGYNINKMSYDSYSDSTQGVSVRLIKD